MADIKGATDERRVVGFRQDRLSAFAVFVAIIVEDERGNQYEFRASCFNFDMKPIKKPEEP